MGTATPNQNDPPVHVDPERLRTTLGRLEQVTVPEVGIDDAFGAITDALHSLFGLRGAGS
jgi:hypothetical protein